MLLTNTRSRPFEITIPVPLQFFFERLESFLLFGTSQIAEDISLEPLLSFRLNGKERATAHCQ
jgi:hypothetical protein